MKQQLVEMFDVVHDVKSKVKNTQANTKLSCARLGSQVVFMPTSLALSPKRLHHRFYNLLTCYDVCKK